MDWGIIPVDGNYLKRPSILKKRVFRKMSRAGKKSLGWEIILLVLFLGTKSPELEERTTISLGLGS